MGTKPSMQIVANIHEIVLLTPFGMRYTCSSTSSPSDSPQGPDGVIRRSIKRPRAWHQRFARKRIAPRPWAGVSLVRFAAGYARILPRTHL